MYTLRFSLPIITLYFTLCTFSVQAMDLRNSVELEEIDIEAQVPKADLLEELKDSYKDSDIEQEKYLLKRAKQLESQKERNKITLMFNNWLHFKRKPSLNLILEARKRHSNIICLYPGFIILVAGFFFSLSNIGNLSILMGIGILMCVILVYEHVKLDCFLRKAQNREFTNLAIDKAQNPVLKVISELHNILRRPNIHKAKHIVTNVVRYAKKERLPNTQDVIHNVIENVHAEPLHNVIEQSQENKS